MFLLCAFSQYLLNIPCKCKNLQDLLLHSHADMFQIKLFSIHHHVSAASVNTSPCFHITSCYVSAASVNTSPSCHITQLCLSCICWLLSAATYVHNALLSCFSCNCFHLTMLQCFLFNYFTTPCCRVSAPTVFTSPCCQVQHIPNRYRYPKYHPYQIDTDTGFIPIFFIKIPIPGIGTWYRYHTGYRSNSTVEPVRWK